MPSNKGHGGGKYAKWVLYNLSFAWILFIFVSWCTFAIFIIFFQTFPFGVFLLVNIPSHP